MSASSVTLEAPWRAGWRAARANLVPGLALWLLGLILVVAYYYHAPTHAALERLSLLRTRLGVWFPILGTALCGGLLPILYLRRNPADRADYQLKNSCFLVLFWAYKGLEVAVWYSLLAHLVGQGTEVRTIAIKMVLDQAVYCPLFGVPLAVVALAFSHAGLRFAPVLADIRAGGWYRRHVLPTLVANAAVWVPVVCLVYALPLALQIVLFDLVLCFYILIMAHIARRKT